MPEMNEVQQSLFEWETAHAKLQIYAEDNDIFQPECWGRWCELRDAETVARNKALALIDACKGVID